MSDENHGKPPVEGKVEKAIREAGWNDRVQVDDTDMGEAVPMLGPISVAVGEMVVEMVKKAQDDGLKAELNNSVLILKGRGADLDGAKTVITAMAGIHDEPVTPDELIDIFTDSLSQIISGSEYQNPFSRLWAIEQVDRELIGALKTISSRNAERMDGFRGWFRQKLGFGARKREGELLMAINDWARQYQIVEKTGELPSTGEESDIGGLDSLSKENFEAK